MQGIEIYMIIGLYFDDNDHGTHKSHSQWCIFWPLTWVVFALIQLDFTKELLSFGCVCVCMCLFCVHCVFIWLCISPWNLGHHIVCLCVCLCLRLGMCGCVYMFVYLCLSMYVSCASFDVFLWLCECLTPMCVYVHHHTTSQYVSHVHIFHIHFVNLLLKLQGFFSQEILCGSHDINYSFFFFGVTKRLWTPTFAILW